MSNFLEAEYFIFKNCFCSFSSFEEAREAAQRMYELQKRNLGKMLNLSFKEENAELDHLQFYLGWKTEALLIPPSLFLLSLSSQFITM